MQLVHNNIGNTTENPDSNPEFAALTNVEAIRIEQVAIHTNLGNTGVGGSCQRIIRSSGGVGVRQIEERPQVVLLCGEVPHCRGIRRQRERIGDQNTSKNKKMERNWAIHQD